MNNEERVVTAMKTNCAYTFTRVMANVKGFFILEVVDDLPRWTDTIENSKSYFTVDRMSDELVLMINVELESTRRQGYHVWVTEFPIDFGSNPNAKKPNQTVLLPL